MPVIQRNFEEKILRLEKKGKKKVPSQLQGETQLQCGKDGAHHRDPVVLNGNVFVSKYALTEWTSQKQEKEGHRKKKMYNTCKDNRFQDFKNIVMICRTSRQCKICWKTQMEDDVMITGRRYQNIKTLIKHFKEVHGVEARIK